MDSTASFLAAHGAAILTVVVILLTMITAFHIAGVSFKKPGHEVVEKVVTIETFTNDDQVHDCASLKGKPHEAEDWCGKLSHMACGMARCCGWLEPAGGEPVCVAGDEEGPTFHSRDGKRTEVKGYEYLGKAIHG